MHANPTAGLALEYQNLSDPREFPMIQIIISLWWIKRITE